MKDRLIKEAHDCVAKHCRVQLRKLANQRPYGDAGPLKALVRGAIDWQQNKVIEELKNQERDAKQELHRCARILRHIRKT